MKDWLYQSKENTKPVGLYIAKCSQGSPGLGLYRLALPVLKPLALALLYRLVLDLLTALSETDGIQRMAYGSGRWS
jgi:hypothetical protein